MRATRRRDVGITSREFHLWFISAVTGSRSTCCVGKPGIGGETLCIHTSSPWRHVSRGIRPPTRIQPNFAAFSKESAEDRLRADEVTVAAAISRLDRSRTEASSQMTASSLLYPREWCGGPLFLDKLGQPQGDVCKDCDQRRGGRRRSRRSRAYVPVLADPSTRI